MKTRKMAVASWQQFKRDEQRWVNGDIILFGLPIIVAKLVFEFAVLCPLTFVCELVGLIK